MQKDNVFYGEFVRQSGLYPEDFKRTVPRWQLVQKIVICTAVTALIAATVFFARFV